MSVPKTYFYPASFCFQQRPFSFQWKIDLLGIPINPVPGACKCASPVPWVVFFFFGNRQWEFFGHKRSGVEPWKLHKSEPSISKLKSLKSPKPKTAQEKVQRGGIQNEMRVVVGFCFFKTNLSPFCAKITSWIETWCLFCHLWWNKPMVKIIYGQTFSCANKAETRDLAPRAKALPAAIAMHYPGEGGVSGGATSVGWHVSGGHISVGVAHFMGWHIPGGVTLVLTWWMAAEGVASMKGGKTKVSLLELQYDFAPFSKAVK